MKSHYLALLLCASVPILRTADAQPAATEYEQMYEQLEDIHIDESKIAAVSDLTLMRDVGTFRLQRGTLHACQPIAGRMVAVLFTGDGTFSMKPPTAIEQAQVFRFYEQDSIEMKFKTLFVLFADSTWEELQGKITFLPGSAPKAKKEVEYCLKYLCDKDTRTFHENFMYTFLHKERNALFYSHFSEEQLFPYFFQVNPFEEEEVSFARRGEFTFWHDRERITQFHTRGEYRAGTDGNDEEKDLVRISDYSMDVHIADNLDFSATAAVTFKSMRDGLRWIPSRLYKELDVDSVSWNIVGHPTHFRETGSSVLWLQAPRPLAGGEVCTITVRYNGDLLEKDELGWIGLRSSSFWYPRFGYRTRANFNLRFHTPAHWLFASVGKRESAELIGDTLVTRWKTVRATHNASFSIGPFKEIVLEGDKSSPETQAGESLPNVSVLEFRNAPKGLGLSDLGEEVRGDMLNCMRFFQHVYGKSPVEDFYATETPYFHGEAFPGLIHLSWATYKYVDSRGANEVFRAHEVAHQWWGVGVNFRTYHDQWLSEAFSEYSGLWYMQSVLKDNKKFFEALDNMRERILGNRKYLFGSGQESGPIWLGYRTQSSKTKGDYSLIVYKKGAWIIHMLRNMMIDLQNMNEDRFKNMMREFYARYLGKEASTRDFQQVVEKHMGIAMDWFFRQWIMGTSVPKYTVSYNTVTQGDKFKTTLRVHQEDVPKEFIMPIPVLVKFDGGRFYRLRVPVSGEKHNYDLPLLPLEPTEVVFNDLSSVLCEVDYKNWE